jgi:hypothetical protein
MKLSDTTINEVLGFYQDQGFPDIYIHRSYVSDLITPPDDLKIIVEEEDYSGEKTVTIFLGKQEDGDPNWRLPRIDYVHLITESRHHIISAELLQSFIEMNDLHITNKVKARGANIVVRIPISWIVYGLQPDIQTFTRPVAADEDQTIKGFRPLCSECGSESSVEHTHIN